MEQAHQWMLLTAITLLVANNSHAWTIGAKGRVSGPTIHTTYFQTASNYLFPVHAKATVGQFVNDNCQYNAVYDLGTTMLKTGDMVAIDAFLLKSVIGGGYTCMTVYYSSKQLVWETIRLLFDGINYSATLPPVAQVTII